MCFVSGIIAHSTDMCRYSYCLGVHMNFSSNYIAVKFQAQNIRGIISTLGLFVTCRTGKAAVTCGTGVTKAFG